MTATMERHEKQAPHFARNANAAEGSLNSWQRVDAVRDGRRARFCAFGGAVAWAVLAVLARVGIARFGAIELLFLFAPLVIVPLGMELGRVIVGAGWLDDIAGWLQPFGAVLAVAAMWIPVGRWAAMAATGWMLVCIVAAADGLIVIWGALSKKHTGEPVPRRFLRASARPVRTNVAVALAIAKIDLAVGGAWLLASRMGWRPMGIQEPIGLLTAVHFHFAGFATATIAAATLAFAARFGEQRWLRRVVALVLGLPFLLAAGFVISPALRMSAAILFSASVATLAVFLRKWGRRAEDGVARTMLQVAAGAVFAAMLFSAAYAIVNFLGSDAITIPQMASTHGVLNAVGFCLPGLLGWLVENVRLAGETSASLL